MREFLDMGGYAWFIWPSWGLSIAALSGLVLYVLTERSAAITRLKALEEDEA